MSILIVDDSSDNRLLLQGILEEEGLGPVHCAGSAAEAFQRLGIPLPATVEPPASPLAPCPDIALILMDIMMPKVNGIQATRLIREDPRYQRLPIVMVTARARGQDLSDAFAAGASDYITKPVDELELTSRVRQALILHYERETRQAREDELERVRNELLVKNRRLNDVLEMMRRDLAAAAELQQSMLPSPESRFDEIEAAWRFHPCDEIGGDLLNLFRFDKELGGFYLFDVAGHGVPSALLAVALSRSLTHWGGEGSLLANAAGKVRDPVDLVALLNRQSVEGPLSGVTSLHYFTMIYGLIEIPRRKFRWVRAGHPFPIHVRADGTVVMLEGGDCPVGLDDEASFTELSVELQPGDRLFLYSDGIVEVKHHETREMFGERRLMDLLNTTLRGVPLGEACDRVVAESGKWLGAEEGRIPFADDVTLLAFEVKSSK